MANEIKTIHDDGAETVYAIVRHMDGKWYDAVAAAWDAYVVADWADYDIAMTEVSAGGAGVNVALQGTFPAGIAAGYYWVDFYIMGGGAAASTDAHLKSILFYWNVTALVPAGATDGLANIDSTGGSLTLVKAVEVIVAWLGGKCTYDAATGIVTYYGQDGETAILTTPLLGGGNRDEPTIS